MIDILLVEDDEDDQEFFKLSIESIITDFNLTILSDGCDALDLIQEKQFDIIFLDINLPKLNGRECLKAIKANTKSQHIPVIICSGSLSDSDIDDVYKNGAHYYVVKPHALINFVASLKIIFEVNWKASHPVPIKDNFLIDYSFNKKGRN
jgi:CheY-like chemotaxis protein